MVEEKPAVKTRYFLNGVQQGVEPRTGPGVYHDRRFESIVRDEPKGRTFRAIKSILRIHRNVTHTTAKSLAAARLLSDHSDVSGSILMVERLRNSLPELLSYEWVSFDTANKAWLIYIDQIVPGCSALPLPLYIGGCPVYIHTSTPETCKYPLYPSKIDDIDPFRICDDTLLRAVSVAFPYSMGMRVHKWGRIEILYASQKMLRRGVEVDGISFDIGSRHEGARVFNVEASASYAQAGMQIAAAPDDCHTLGCLGLRIRRRGQNEDDWTTTTHSCMNLPSIRPIRLSNWKANALVLARRSRILSSAIDRLTGPEVEGRRAQTVLGNSVYLAGTRQKVGTITKCYDALPLPDSTLMFPLGLDHDLSLVTGVDLPTMELPPDCPIPESTFADPEEALYAPAVFLWETLVGLAVTGPARQALVVGMDYFWETRHVKAKRALIWRTNVDDRSASGSTLFMGSPSARTAKAVVFQNYETKIGKNSFWSLDAIRPTLKEEQGSFKGGFLLPEEIRAAEIILGERVGRQPRISHCR